MTLRISAHHGDRAGRRRGGVRRGRGVGTPERAPPSCRPEWTGTRPARLLVYAQEWSLWPSRPSVKAGTVIVQLWNRGQDAHDLRIRRLSRGAMVGRTQGDAVTQSGKLSQATWRLSPGTYELYCSMPGHLSEGMHTRITVR